MIKLYDRLIELNKNNKSQLSSILGLFYNIKTDFQILNKSKNKKLIYMLKYFIYYNTKIEMKLRNTYISKIKIGLKLSY